MVDNRDLLSRAGQLEQNGPHPFDERIADNFAAGQLDKVIQKALDDGKNSRLHPLVSFAGHYPNELVGGAQLERAVK